MPKNGRRTLIVGLTALVTVLTLSVGGLALARATPVADGNRITSTSVDAGNLLPNGDFDDGYFYSRPTNHYVAWPWFEWWGDYNAIPEYIDGSHPHHNECYPPPADGRCQNSTIGAPDNHSQGYIRYGPRFTAGIYQPVTQGIMPCTLYTFEIYNRNDSSNYHAKVGIDVSGWVITRLGNSRPDNCPPDGTSRCPDPYIAGFPSTTVWSAESRHPARTWAPISVTAEALASTISVWTYANPDPNVHDDSPSQSAYWDYGRLVQTPFPGNRLPDPDSWSPSPFITNVEPIHDDGRITITWDTLSPASTQLLYTVEYSITTTGPLSNVVFLPVIAVAERLPYLDLTPKLQHSVVLPGRYRIGDRIDFVALSRRVDETVCRTETSGPLSFEVGSNYLVSLSPERVPALIAGP